MQQTLPQKKQATNVNNASQAEHWSTRGRMLAGSLSVFGGEDVQSLIILRIQLDIGSDEHIHARPSRRAVIRTILTQGLLACLFWSWLFWQLLFPC